MHAWDELVRKRNIRGSRLRNPCIRVEEEIQVEKKVWVKSPVWTV